MTNFFCFIIIIFHYFVTLGPKPPNISRITSDSPTRLDVAWIPHCKNVCDQHFRKPKFYTIKYTHTGSNMDFARKAARIVNSLPVTAIALEDRLESNTPYKVSVSTNIYSKGGRTVNSDLSEEKVGITG